MKTYPSIEQSAEKLEKWCTSKFFATSEDELEHDAKRFFNKDRPVLTCDSFFRNI